jgi:hypothetical protein
VRLSKPRLVLRAVLLLVLAGFMAFRAKQTGQSAAEPGLPPAGATMLSRIALVEWVLCGLAVLTAGAALLALRRRPPGHMLHMGTTGISDTAVPETAQRTGTTDTTVPDTAVPDTELGGGDREPGRHGQPPPGSGRP